MSQQQQPTPSAIPCPAGLRLIGSTPAIWIESPRTGRRVVFTDGWWSDLPARLSARVVLAASTGCRLVAFSREELAAVANLARRIEAHCRPAPQPVARPASRSFSGHHYLRRPAV